MLLLAGVPRASAARRWDEAVVTGSRILVLLAIGSGIVWLLVRTALFEGRAQAALDPRAVLRAVLDTWPGFVWLARHGVLLVLAAFLAIRPDVGETRNWIAARAEALLLAALSLALVSGSSHAAAITPGTRLAHPAGLSPGAAGPGRHGATRRCGGVGGGARPRGAGAGGGDDADDAGPPRRAGLAVAVPTLAGCPARCAGHEVAGAAGQS